ncbi:DUF1801 domain-containing protein [Kineococcus glutinatus]|uniref:DUF1801 domain-containing protein n=1 Tax=Kineococcus glutinatus TaxID=1070872 RepID=A0ABP9I0J0_9ACTN
MVTSTAATVEEYLDALEPDRRETLTAVRALVLENLPPGYAETTALGMPTYVVPLERYPDTYNGRPLSYVAFAAQRQHNSLYLMGLYSDPEAERAFREEWTASGCRLDMGKSCLHFRRLGDLDLPLLARTIASRPVERFLATSARMHGRQPAK